MVFGVEFGGRDWFAWVLWGVFFWGELVLYGLGKCGWGYVEIWKWELFWGIVFYLVLVMVISLLF